MGIYCFAEMCLLACEEIKNTVSSSTWINIDHVWEYIPCMKADYNELINMICGGGDGGLYTAVWYAPIFTKFV